MTKELAIAFPKKKQLRNMRRKKMNIAADKYPRTNTVKTLHLLSSFKVKHVM